MTLINNTESDMCKILIVSIVSLSLCLSVLSYSKSKVHIEQEKTKQIEFQIRHLEKCRD